MDKMAKAFTRIGKDIAIAIKQGTSDPATNARLRIAIQNAKGVNMPKDRIDAAIKRATSKDSKNLEEINYEGYAPHGIAVYVETATDNPTRTVANVRVIFSRGNGNLGNSGSIDFLFERKGEFVIPKSAINLDEMELDLIDLGAEEIEPDEDKYIVYTKFSDFGNMNKGLEERGIVVESAAVKRFPLSTKELPEEQENEVLELIAKLEEDDDVQAVYHTLA